MTITTRTLNKWRREALRTIDKDKKYMSQGYEQTVGDTQFKIYANRILRMTQELLDSNLLKEN